MGEITLSYKAPDDSGYQLPKNITEFATEFATRASMTKTGTAGKKWTDDLFLTYKPEMAPVLKKPEFKRYVNFWLYCLSAGKTDVLVRLNTLIALQARDPEQLDKMLFNSADLVSLSDTVVPHAKLAKALGAFEASVLDDKGSYDWSRVLTHEQLGDPGFSFLLTHNNGSDESAALYAVAALHFTRYFRCQPATMEKRMTVKLGQGSGVFWTRFRSFYEECSITESWLQIHESAAQTLREGYQPRTKNTVALLWRAVYLAELREKHQGLLRFAITQAYSYNGLFLLNVYLGACVKLERYRGEIVLSICDADDIAAIQMFAEIHRGITVGNAKSIAWGRCFDETVLTHLSGEMHKIVTAILVAIVLYGVPQTEQDKVWTQKKVLVGNPYKGPAIAIAEKLCESVFKTAADIKYLINPAAFGQHTTAQLSQIASSRPATKLPAMVTQPATQNRTANQVLAAMGNKATAVQAASEE